MSDNIEHRTFWEMMNLMHIDPNEFNKTFPPHNPEDPFAWYNKRVDEWNEAKWQPGMLMRHRITLLPTTQSRLSIPDDGE